ncbi:MAG: Asp-tRNA(Asn)/Glu-tRNA(Gln) amidotransferase subunit GatC [Bacteroidota bacterium]|nr:Asp-tRNA(Asn)/Glu-tRNA(Gln) amidotransferase subunit GatC [Bacteroidota bacterium]MDP4236614.1 Asp-tRNA(Asn)/Glu-tRNA(Gln) amidotransferase subunit GatC [Bacteroidota bacterium]
MVTRENVEHIAKLARLDFSDEEYAKLTMDMNNVLGYIDQLKELDVSAVEPLENINETSEINFFRTDISEPSLSAKEALQNAPKSGDGYFLVPKVIEQVKKDDKVVDVEEEEEEL